MAHCLKACGMWGGEELKGQFPVACVYSFFGMSHWDESQPGVFSHHVSWSSTRCGAPPTSTWCGVGCYETFLCYTLMTDLSSSPRLVVHDWWSTVWQRLGWTWSQSPFLACLDTLLLSCEALHWECLKSCTVFDTQRKIKNNQLGNSTSSSIYIDRTSVGIIYKALKAYNNGLTLQYKAVFDTICLKPS